jgi:DNA-binding Lrp family transcriptional regulator
VKDKILKILQKNAKISHQTIADRLGVELEEIASLIASLEEDGVVLGYRTVFDDSKIDDSIVRAIIEVKLSPTREDGYDTVANRISRFTNVSAVYLMSGHYDLMVHLGGENIADISFFVATRLSTLPGVISCSTHFLLKKYKEAGFCSEMEEKRERLVITP